MNLNQEKLDLWLSRRYEVEVNEFGVECKVESPDVYCLECDTLLYNFIINGQPTVYSKVCENCGIKNYILGTEIKFSMNHTPRFIYKIKVLAEASGTIRSIPLMTISGDTGKVIKTFSMKEWLEK